MTTRLFDVVYLMLQFLMVKVSNGAAVTVTTPADMTETIPPEYGCPVPWVPYQSHCYLFPPEPSPVTWYEGQELCEQYGTHLGLTAHLVSIHSFSEDYFIANIIEQLMSKTGGSANMVYVLIGLQQAAVGSNDYTWSDGSALNYTNWNAGEPDPNSPDLQCGYIQVTQSGFEYWSDFSCNHTVVNYPTYIVCKGDRELVTTPAQIEGECPPGWKAWHDHCYYASPIIEEPITADSAEILCQEQVAAANRTAHLVSIGSWEENTFVRNLFPTAGELDRAIIGFRTTNTSTTDYQWTDGSPVTYTNWYPGEPGNPSPPECAFMAFDWDTYRADTWWPQDCAESLITISNVYFVCKTQRAIGSTTPTTVSTITTPTTISTTTIAISTTTTATPTATTNGPGSSATTTTTMQSTPTTPSPPSTGGQVAGIVVGVVVGVGALIAGVFLWRRYEINTTLKSLWHNFQSDRNNRRGHETLDNVSVGGMSTTSDAYLSPSKSFTVGYNPGTDSETVSGIYENDQWNK